jgi:hypothetical protein
MLQRRRGAVSRRNLLVSLLVLGVVGIAGWYVLGHSSPTPWNKPADVDGATVRLTYSGSACQDSADVEVGESDTRVVITVVQTVRARSCDEAAVPYDVVVRLSDPLAGRMLVDGACEIEEYARYVACAG